MLTKSLIAAAAVATTLALGSATSAQADPNVNFSFGIGVGVPGGDFSDNGPDPFFQPGYPHHRFHHRHWNQWADFPPPPRPVSYGISCGTGRDILRSQGFRNVQAYDCTAPVYGYQAWKRGDIYRVNVNFRGQIVAVDPIY